MAVSITTLGAAIQAWVAAQSGLPTIWRSQNGTRPAAPYIELNITTQSEGLPIRSKADAPSPSAGAEIEIIFKQKERLELEITSFGGDASGDNSSKQRLSALQNLLPLPSHKLAFCDMGWVPTTFAKIVDISGALASQIEARAITQWIGYYWQDTRETGTYVGTVEMDDVIRGGTTTATID